MSDIVERAERGYDEAMRKDGTFRRDWHRAALLAALALPEEEAVRIATGAELGLVTVADVLYGLKQNVEGKLGG